jgi:Flp pilus assembly protein TadB
VPAVGARDNAAVRGPGITIKCDCGASAKVAYPAVHECAECGRRWSTAQIPEADYAAIRRLDRRYRTVGWAAGMVFAGFLLFVLLVNPGQMIVIVPAGLLGWFAFVRNPVRRRYWREIQKLTRSWELTPER